MATFGRYPRLYEGLEPEKIEHLEAFSKSSLDGDFIAVDKLWTTSLHELPHSFLKDIVYIDSVLRQNRYGDAGDYIDRIPEVARSSYASDQRLLLNLIKAYTGIFTQGALRYALRIARDWRARVLGSGLDATNEIHVCSTLHTVTTAPKQSIGAYRRNIPPSGQICQVPFDFHNK